MTFWKFMNFSWNGRLPTPGRDDNAQKRQWAARPHVCCQTKVETPPTGLGSIPELCAERQWSYYKLAKESGIAYSTISTMLSKTAAPSIPTLFRICRGFDISISQFFATDDQIELTEGQKECLSYWNSLDTRSRELALAYMAGLAKREDWF